MDLSDTDIGRYYDRHQAHLVADVPDEGAREDLRRSYIAGVRQNPEAQRQIAEVLSQEDGVDDPS